MLPRSCTSDTKVPHVLVPLHYPPAPMISAPTAETARELRLVATVLSGDRLCSCQNRAFLRSLAVFGSSAFSGEAAECSIFKSSLVRFT